MSSKKPETDTGQARGLDPCLAAWPGAGSIVVAFSGGPDSACLLHLLAEQNPTRPVQAIHVDHGLDRGSRQRAARAKEMAEALDIPCRVERVQVRRSGSIEANARHARYEVLMRHIGSGDVLLTAHHADDVAETLLLRLLRGSGPGGLGGIPGQRRFGGGHLIRPLLGWRREEIQAYLDRHQVISIRDPANDLVSLDRNFLRHEILPLLRGRFPGCVQAFSRTARLNRAAGEVLAQLADSDLERIEALGPCLPLEALCKLEPFHRAEVIRRWCLRHDRTPPPGQRLDEFMRQIDHAAADRQPILDWEEGRLQRHGAGIWLRSPARAQVAWRLRWDGADVLQLPEPSGSLRFSAPPPRFELSVRSGSQGERLRLHPNSGRRPVKKILAEAGVPPWQRNEWPRIWRDNRLVALGDRWLDPAFSRLLQEHGVQLFWHSELRRHGHA